MNWTVPALGARATGGLRLIFFPFAGGGASAFADWQNLFPATIETYAVQFPGRETRWGEAPFATLGELVVAIVDELMPAVQPPFAFVGHSMGGVVAYEVTRLLQRRGGKPPVHLFLAATTPPHVRRETGMHLLPDDEFLQRLHTFGGLPQALLNNQEFLDLLLPIIKNDFRLYEQHVVEPGEPVRMPITVFGGLQDSEDPVPLLEAWRDLTIASFASEAFPGGHFFLFDRPAEIADRIRTGLLRTLAPPPAAR